MKRWPVLLCVAYVAKALSAMCVLCLTGCGRVEQGTNVHGKTSQPATRSLVAPESMLLSVYAEPDDPFLKDHPPKVRVWRDGPAKWVPLKASGLIPRAVGPAASSVLVYDPNLNKRIFYSAADKSLVIFSKGATANEDCYPSGLVDDRGIWSTRANTDKLSRYDLQKRRWHTTNEPCDVIEGSKFGRTRVLVSNNQWKEISVERAWFLPLLPSGQVLAIRPSGKAGVPGALCIWDVAADKSTRDLCQGVRWCCPSPDGKFASLWVPSSGDLVWGTQCTVLDLQTGLKVDKFAWNYEGTERLEWAGCSQAELETTLAALRAALDEEENKRR